MGEPQADGRVATVVAGSDTSAVPLLERDHILASLTEYLHAAQDGDGRFVLVSGEAGVGKSAVLREFRDTAAPARWAEGRCDGLFTPRPLGPLFDIAATLGGPLLEACRRGAQREDLFRLLLEELDAGDSGAATVLVIEDVHWADESSLDLLGFLGRRVRALGEIGRAHV